MKSLQFLMYDKDKTYFSSIFRNSLGERGTDEKHIEVKYKYFWSYCDLHGVRG